MEKYKFTFADDAMMDNPKYNSKDDRVSELDSKSEKCHSYMSFTFEIESKSILTPRDICLIQKEWKNSLEDAKKNNNSTKEVLERVTECLKKNHPDASLKMFVEIEKTLTDENGKEVTAYYVHRGPYKVENKKDSIR